MKYTFNREDCIAQWSNINKAMLATLAETIEGKYTRDELTDYLKRVISDGEPLAANPEMVFWGYDEPQTMPSDGRCEFFYLPTYIMVQTMIAAILRYPDLMHICGLSDTLSRGLSACTGRDLQGSGYDGMCILLENMRMFLRAGAKEFLQKYPDLCPAFTKLFNAIIATIREDYESGRHVFDWDHNYKDEQKDLLALYDAL